MVLELVSVSVSVSVDKGRDNRDKVKVRDRDQDKAKDRWELLQCNKGRHHPRLDSLASRAQWSCTVLLLVPVPVLGAQGVEEEYCSGDGEGASVGSETCHGHVPYCSNLLYIPCISRSLAPMHSTLKEFLCSAIREEVVILLPVYKTITPHYRNERRDIRGVQ